MEIKNYFAIFKNFNISHKRAIHSIKTTIACLIGLAIKEYFQLPMGQWIPITTMVVMSAQTHFGGAVNKAMMRLWGTICGITTVICVLWLFGNNLYVVFITILFTTLVFSYIASSHNDISYAGTLGGVTVILILSTKNLGMEEAVQRGLYIIVGISIALLASRFIFPIHARDRLRYHVASTLRNLRKLYFEAIKLNGDSKSEIIIDTELNARVIADIASQPRLIHEAAVGSRIFSSKKIIFNSILNSEQNLSRLINLTYLSLREAELSPEIKEQLNSVENLHDIIGNGLNHLAKCFEFKTEPQKIINLDASLDNIVKTVEKLPKNGCAQKLIAEHSFLFFIEQILKELENLRSLITKVNSKNSNSVV